MTTRRERTTDHQPAPVPPAEDEQREQHRPARDTGDILTRPDQDPGNPLSNTTGEYLGT